MNGKALRARIVRLATQGKALGDPEVFDFYGILVEEHGKRCADHFLTIMTLARRGATINEVETAVDVLVRTHPSLGAQRQKVRQLVGLGFLGGTLVTGAALSEPIVRVFASVGIVGAALLAVILLFRDPIRKVLFTRLSAAQSERVIKWVLLIVGIVVVIAVIGGVVVAIIKAVQPGVSS